MKKTILVPTDFSGYADFAISSAARFAQKIDGRILLFHVLDGHLGTRANAEEQLKLIESSGIMGDVPFEFELGAGNPVEAIVEKEADYIVIGSRIVKGIQSFFNTTNAEKIAKQASCSVITLKQYLDLSEIKNIVYPTDMRAEHEDFIEELKDLQKIYNAHVHMVKVYGDVMVNDKQVEKRLIDFANFHSMENYSVHALSGMNESDEIVRFAEEIDADMVAMLTHQRSSVERLFAGFISGGVIRHSRTAIYSRVADMD